ncbi:L-fucose:H+ symporter permease [Mucilaginibacter pedocola]|uniref:L-fucose:H+ symporter permease n=1 Tax=Mucilaginibacter pedocola TaxID=1792845 RepID=A0A1S9PFA2_9SPHI|nr:L-fucose:H+ symporter permease [Mucilaginibacter pedocola]OOQ59634.1 L-fucose:H+ symporter permease [Mucilaginibacter pedocola]
MQKNSNAIAVALITSLFFLWGFALNLNPILIPHLKKACQLSDFQSSLIDSASYVAYFIFPIPAALFMKKYGYKGGIVFGLLLFSVGAILFYPAADARNYAYFLGALFVVFSGMAFLETAANPLITLIGDPSSATVRINMAQTFNGLAAALAPFIGKTFILSGTVLTDAQEKAMPPEQLNAYLNHEASSVKLPFVVISVVVLLVAIFVWRTAFPEIHEESAEVRAAENKPLLGRIKVLIKDKHLMSGVLAEFFYVGGQACVTSFFIRYSEHVAGFGEHTAAELLSVALLLFMFGRLSGTALMLVFNPVKLLVTYAIINIGLIAAAVTLHGAWLVYVLMAVLFFMSIMFPTIFSLSIRDLDAPKKKLGSSLVIMGIVGGAIMPPIMGRVSDMTNIQMAYIVPGISFVAILWFALRNLKVKTVEMVGGH